MGAVTNSWVEDLVVSEYCNCSPSGDY